MTALIVRGGGRELDGVVRAGESWLAAARRTAASLSAEPEPVDLSGQTKMFRVAAEHQIQIRAMVRDDLDRVAAWRRDPVLKRWWSAGEIRSDADLERTYGERIDGLSPTRMWVVEVDRRPAGFVQDYRLRDYPELATTVPDPEAISVDYALGEARWRGQGLGAPMLWAWALQARRRFPDATAYFSGPDERNAASLRILAKAGFSPGERFEQLQLDGGRTTMIGCTLDVATVLGAAGIG